jgi:hypothetical protein
MSLLTSKEFGSVRWRIAEAGTYFGTRDLWSVRQRRAILPSMEKEIATDRLVEAGARARDAEARGDDRWAGEEWRRYRLIRDAARDPDDLLAEGIALSPRASELVAPGR